MRPIINIIIKNNNNNNNNNDDDDNDDNNNNSQNSFQPNFSSGDVGKCSLQLWPSVFKIVVEKYNVLFL